MKEYKIEKLSLSYSMIEDRLEAKCLVSGQPYSMWISQRMFQKLMPPLLKKAGENSSERLFTSGYAAQAFDEMQSESPVSKASSPKRQDAIEKGEPMPLAEVKDVVPSDQSLDNWLAVTINVSFNDQSVNLAFMPQSKQFSFILPLSLDAINMLLLAFQKTAKIAEWPFNWPDWLTTEVDKKMKSDVALH